MQNRAFEPYPIFISYRGVDNQPKPAKPGESGGQGWVDTFVDWLKWHLGPLVGDIPVWFDVRKRDKIDANAYELRPDMNAKDWMIGAAAQSPIMIAITTNAYFLGKWTMFELRTFCQLYPDPLIPGDHDLGTTRIKDVKKSQIAFQVVINTIPEGDPARLALKQLDLQRGFAFCNPSRPLFALDPDEHATLYRSAMEDLATAIYESMKSLRGLPSKSSSASTSHPEEISPATNSRRARIFLGRAPASARGAKIICRNQLGANYDVDEIVDPEATLSVGSHSDQIDDALDALCDVDPSTSDGPVPGVTSVAASPIGDNGAAQLTYANARVEPGSDQEIAAHLKHANVSIHFVGPLTQKETDDGLGLQIQREYAQATIRAVDSTNPFKLILWQQGDLLTGYAEAFLTAIRGQAVKGDADTIYSAIEKFAAANYLTTSATVYVLYDNNDDGSLALVKKILKTRGCLYGEPMRISRELFLDGSKRADHEAQVAKADGIIILLSSAADPISPVRIIEDARNIRTAANRGVFKAKAVLLCEQSGDDSIILSKSDEQSLREVTVSIETLKVPQADLDEVVLAGFFEALGGRSI